MRAAFFLLLALALSGIAPAIRFEMHHTSVMLRAPHHHRESASTRTRASKKVVYAGCFCPPHKGDFEAVKALYGVYDEIFIYASANAELYHGYTFKVKDEIWKEFIKEIDNEGKIRIAAYHSSADGTPSDIVLPAFKPPETLDVAVVIEGPQGKEFVQASNSSMSAAKLVDEAQVTHAGPSWPEFRTQFRQELDQCAYRLGVNPKTGALYEEGTQIIYTSQRGLGKFFGVIGEDHVTVSLEVGGIKKPTQAQLVGPVLNYDDLATYTSLRTRNRAFAKVIAKTEAGYQVRPQKDPETVRVVPLADIEPMYPVLDPIVVHSAATVLKEFLPITVLHRELDDEDVLEALLLDAKRGLDGDHVLRGLKGKVFDFLSKKSKLG